MQTGWRTVNAGSRLKPPITQEGTAWKASLPAVLGKLAVRCARINPEEGNENVI